MTDVSPIHAAPLARIGPGSAPGRDASPAVAAGPRRPLDRVEVSLTSTLLSRLRQLPAIRQELVDEVRAKIAKGEYDSPEVLDRALDSLIDDAVQGPPA